MKLMKYISIGIKGLILLILFLLAFLNIQDVKFTYLPDQAIDLPLIAVLFGGFVVGTVFGIFAMFGRLLRLRHENHRLRGEVQKTARLSREELQVAEPTQNTAK